jgi:hypothetical protein
VNVFSVNLVIRVKKSSTIFLSFLDKMDPWYSGNRCMIVVKLVTNLSSAGADFVFLFFFSGDDFFGIFWFLSCGLLL